MESKNQNLITGILVICLIFLSIFGMSVSFSEKISEDEPQVYVKSALGCIPIKDSPSEFEAKQGLREIVYGGELTRCR